MTSRRTSPSWRRISLLLLLPLVSCATLAEREVERLASRGLGLANDVELLAGDLKLFRQCFAERSASCQGDTSTALPHTAESASGKPAAPAAHGSSRLLETAVSNLPPGHPAKDAYRVLGHSVARKSSALYNHLRGHPTNISATEGFEVELKEDLRESLVKMDLGFREIGGFGRLLLGSIGGRGFDRLETLCTSLGEYAAGSGAGDLERRALEHDCRPVAFVRQYMSAYFRNGEIVELKVDTSGLVERVGRLEAKVDESVGDLEPLRDAAAQAGQAIDRSIAEATEKINRKLSQVVRVSNVGFLSRDTTWGAKFPSFEVTLDPTASHPLTVRDLSDPPAETSAVHLEQLGGMNDRSGASIGADLVRVFLEALFDAHEGLPALAPKNAPPATGLDVGSWSLPLFDPPMGNVSTEDWNAMTRINSQVEAMVEAILSRAVAGIGPLSLNNPALEALVVEVLTTSVRKAAEKASWCWYACNLDVDVKKVETEVGALLKNEAKKMAGQVTAAADQAARTTATFAHDAAEKVKLRLRLRE